jgi:enoyl-CoA hydratase
MEFNGFTLELSEITRLVFNRPVNILSTPVVADLIRALGLLKESEDIKVLVIAATGPTFLAGADIKEMSAMDEAGARRFAEHIHSAMNALEGLNKPVIAEVQGFCLGGGCELLLATDLAVASSAAVFGQPEVDLGIIPGAGATQRLKKRIGILKAKELIYTGRKVSAIEAAGMGLINKVAAPGKLSEEVMELARVIAAKPIQCVTEAKSLLNDGSLEDEIDSFVKMFGYGDQSVMMKSFLSRSKK